MCLSGQSGHELDAIGNISVGNISGMHMAHGMRDDGCDHRQTRSTARLPAQQARPSGPVEPSAQGSEAGPTMIP